ncbi:MAG TPA: PadR family transcriptional regulator [Ktedonobacteraceae bacterium]|nr:PadR family transcriptional regulator [Ktedonobacteraceae bacterium]
MYELLVLALLMHGPWHGYLITKIANEMIGPWARISPGTLYPLLARLEQAGLIEALPQQEAAHSQRQTRRYTITPAGQRRFHTLMMDTSSNLGDYPRIFHLKAVHFQFLSSRERLYLTDHYLNYCERTILHMQSEAQDMQRMQFEAEQTQSETGDHADFTGAVVEILQHLAQQEQGELAWVRRMRERAVVALDAQTQAEIE